MVQYKTIRRNGEFKRAYSRGNRFIGSVLVCYIFKNRLGETRAGITASKKIGNAVRRNRAKRVIRAAFDQLYPCLKGGYDIILVARTRTTMVKSTKVKEYLEKTFKEAGIVK